MAINGTSPHLDFTTFGNIVNGQVVQTKTTRHNINPSTLEANPEVPVASQADVDEAVRHARAAAKQWAEVPLEKRQQAVLDLAGALRAAMDDFALMLTKEQGKPLMFAKDEINRAAQWLEVQARLPFPDDIIEETAERIVKTRYTPCGVAVAIVPWNCMYNRPPHNAMGRLLIMLADPLLLACGKIAPALITGNALILKPSPFTPYCDLKLAELAQKFFPPGVFQALSGDDSLGPMLTEHPGVDKVSFTGSTATGKRVMQSCAKTLKRVTLELGGNDPAIVCGDVDIMETATKVAQLAFLNSGQVCVAIKRIYVHASIYDHFLGALVQIAQALPVGDGLADNIILGPVQNSMQYERVKGFLKDIEDNKLNIAAGGRSAEEGKGYFVFPTLIDNPPDNSRIVKEEPFGPVAPILKWETEEDVIARANDSDMGLGASVWSKDAKQAERIALKLDAGTVWVNNHLDLRPDATFGGHKQSGIGSEWGKEGLKAYCNTQTLHLAKA